MPWWRMTPGVRKHPAIEADETVIHACYGLSAGFVRMANRTADPTPASGPRPAAWDDDFMNGATGLASVIDQTGVLALTDRRVLFFAKRFAIGRPKNLIGEWPLEQVRNMSYDKSETVLRIEFTDGSHSGLHVPPSQSPAFLVERFSELSAQ